MKQNNSNDLDEGKSLHFRSIYIACIYVLLIVHVVLIAKWQYWKNFATGSQLFEESREIPKTLLRRRVWSPVLQKPYH